MRMQGQQMRADPRGPARIRGADPRGGSARIRTEPLGPRLICAADPRGFVPIRAVGPRGGSAREVLLPSAIVAFPLQIEWRGK